jgi:hypothetical protein
MMLKKTMLRMTFAGGLGTALYFGADMLDSALQPAPELLEETIQPANQVSEIELETRLGAIVFSLGVAAISGKQLSVLKS